ncbi:hypothetical protein NE237_021436 [Protea cynaroides]|uniref:Uncharacterized protein n=1 Tax=Protea cynaroides TaxID=273540 RepID=A0A9Q0HA95_9MAGN|nr:hypothetical protein NE237_021436 [Protea cynaroides]
MLSIAAASAPYTHLPQPPESRRVSFASFTSSLIYPGYPLLFLSFSFAFVQIIVIPSVSLQFWVF